MDLSKLSDEDLDARAVKLTTERGEAEAKYKAEQQDVNRERSRRANRIRLASVLDGLPEDERDELLAEIGG